MSYLKQIKKWGGIIGVQSLGPLSALMTTWFLARFGGPLLQGEFAQYKSLIDLLFVLGSFGFPQAIVYIINKNNTSIRKIASYSTLYCIFITPAFIAITYLYFKNTDNYKYDILEATITSIAASLLMLHGFYRAIYLSKNQDIGFSIATILPPAFLLLLLLISIKIKETNDYYFSIVYFFSNILACIITFSLIRNIIKKDSFININKKIYWNLLINHSLHSFLQSFLIAIQPFLAYTIIKKMGGSNGDVGFLNIGIFLAQGISTPISMIAPILFSRWTKLSNSTISLITFTKKYKIIILIAYFIIGIAFVYIAYITTPIFFGEIFSDASLATSYILFSLPFLLHSKALSPAFHALGHPKINTSVSFLRFTSFLSISLIGLFFLENTKIINILAVAWSASEVIAGIQHILFSSRHSNDQ